MRTRQTMLVLHSITILILLLATSSRAFALKGKPFWLELFGLIILLALVVWGMNVYTNSGTANRALQLLYVLGFLNALGLSIIRKDLAIVAIITPLIGLVLSMQQKEGEQESSRAQETMMEEHVPEVTAPVTQEASATPKKMPKRRKK